MTAVCSPQAAVGGTFLPTMTEALCLELLTRQHCGLCEKARLALEAVGRSVPLQVESVDIDEDDALLREFHVRVPVIRRQGRVVCEGVITEGGLRAALGAEVRA